MADDTDNTQQSTDLDPGFNDVPLDQGFQEVPLTSAQPQSVGQNLYQRFANLGNSALQTGKNALQAGVEDLSDTGRGLVQGVSLGGSDELIALAKATSEAKPGSDDWKQLYRKYQQSEQQKNQQAQQRSPYLYGAGQFTGLVAPAVLTAGASIPEEGAALAGKLSAGQIAQVAAKTGLVGAGTGAVASGLQSENGALIGATPQQQSALGADVLGGAVTGGVLGAGLGAATKVVPAVWNAVKNGTSSKFTNYIADSPFWRQVMASKNLGEQGTNIYSQKAILGDIGKNNGLIQQDTNAVLDLNQRVYNIDDYLGQQVGDTLNNATDQGITGDLTDPMLNSVNTFKNLMEKDQTLMANPKAQKLYDTIFQMAGDNGEFDASNMTPIEIQSLRNSVLDFSDSIKLQNPGIANLGFQFGNDAGNLLKSIVPDYKIAAERFEQFRRLVPETIISGSTPVDISGIKLGNLKNDEAKLFASTKSMLQGVSMPGTGASNAKETFKNLLNGINEFEQSEAGRVASGAIPVNEPLPKLVDASDVSQSNAMGNLIQKRADQSALLQQAWRVNPQENVGTSIQGATFGRGALVNMANKYGLAKNALTKPMATPIALTKQLYGAQEAVLRDVGEKISNIPGISSAGDALLRGLDNKDVTGINAAIFHIMQNPQSRILINSLDLDNKGDNNGQ